ncbi:hypothetical protein G5V59_08905 [Nocardioides sp. W3-2-3]|uniref:hypothetical protein n=1 Tax=Nocardioides convexus TaxID=2712224 RepID=UPI0024182F4A|nr:hypothetical protein [Nocardioides convexus]NHA00206.1 hypothetical protein [Nocardioides convexus]
MSLVRLARVVCAALLVLLVAACGSRLDPDTVARAGGGSGGNGSGDGSLAGADTGTTGGSGDTGAVGGTSAGGDTGTGSGGSAGTSGGGTSAGGSTGGGASTGGGSTGGGAKGSATGGVKAGSCTGFKNQKGITDKTITLANISDISGPVPGIFESAQQATQAYVKYFNSTGSICGRKAGRGAPGQPRRRGRRPAGLRQGVRQRLRRGRLDVGLRQRGRGHGQQAAASRTCAR